MRKKYELEVLFNDLHYGSIQIGDKNIHNTLSNIKEAGVYYRGVLGELKDFEGSLASELQAVLNQMTRTVETNFDGYFKETFEFETQAIFQRQGTYTDPTPVKSKSVTWEMTVENFESKVADMNQLEVKTLKKRGKSPLPEFVKAMNRVIKTYTTKLVPALQYRALYKPVTVGGTYESQFGLLRDVVVDKNMLSTYDENAPVNSKGHTKRNHFRAIKNPSTIAGQIGLTPTDIAEARDYLRSYEENENKTIIAFAGSNIITKLKTYFTTPEIKDDLLVKNVKALEIEGVNIINATSLVPENFIFFVAYDTDVEAGHIFTRLVFPDPEYQGLWMDMEGNNFGWESLNEYNLKDVKVMVGDTNIELTGRHRALWLDCGNRPQTDGLMTQAGIDILDKNYNKYYRQIIQKF